MKHKTILLMEQEWKRDISNKPKLIPYINLKENFAIPDYVSTLIPKPHFCSILLWKFTLRVETGRRQRVREDTTGQTRSIKLEERVCLICSSGEVEDEYHFLLKCNVFADISVDYINNIMRNNAGFINLTLEQKCTFLITKCWRETLHFICKAWAKRKTCLYLFSFPPQHTVYVLFVVTFCKVTLKANWPGISYCS